MLFFWFFCYFFIVLLIIKEKYFKYVMGLEMKLDFFWKRLINRKEYSFLIKLLFKNSMYFFLVYFK